MSDEGRPEVDHPTNHILHTEQTKQGMLLERLCEDVHDIKICLMGEPDKREGLLFDVDRLKRTHATLRAVVWVIFTAVLGLGATALGSMFIGK